MNFSKYILALFFISSLMACKKEEPEEPSVDPPTFALDATGGVTSGVAYVSGTVTGQELKEVGFVYSTHSGLNEGSPRIHLRDNAGTIATNINDLDPGTKYFYAAYAVNKNNEFFKSEYKSFTTLTKPVEKEEPKYVLGDTFEGGIIYYLDNTGEHGLMASPEDIKKGSNWQTANDACKSYELNGNDDWRLPSLNDLQGLYNAKEHIPNLADIAYWSSTFQDINETLVRGVYFGSGSNAGKTFIYDKTDSYQHSRAIRNF